MLLGSFNWSCKHTLTTQIFIIKFYKLFKGDNTNTLVPTCTCTCTSCMYMYVYVTLIHIVSRYIILYMYVHARTTRNTHTHTHPGIYTHWNYYMYTMYTLHCMSSPEKSKITRRRYYQAQCTTAHKPHMYTMQYCSSFSWNSLAYTYTQGTWICIHIHRKLFGGWACTYTCTPVHVCLEFR